MITAATVAQLPADIIAARNTGQGLFIPAGLWELPEPLDVPSTVTLFGEGIGTIIKPAAGYSKEALIRLTGDPACQRARISDLYFYDPELSGIAAIQAVAAQILNCRFERLHVETRRGLMLDTYTQGSLVEDVWHMNGADQILELVGNMNVVRGLDKEGSSGSSADPYIYVSGYANNLSDIIVEGIGSTNKTAVMIEDAPNTRLANLYCELSASDYLLRVVNSPGTVLDGLPILSPSVRFQVSASRGVQFRALTSEIHSWRSRIEMVDGATARVDVCVGPDAGSTDWGVELR